MDELCFWEYENNKSNYNLSILMSSYNTKNEYIIDCFDSISNQKGFFNIEIVIINDGSDKEYSDFLEIFLEIFLENKNNLKIIYKKMNKNKGLSYCLHEGVLLCSNELIIRMDTDDIMDQYKIITQLTFMIDNLSCVLCGTNLISFTENDQKEKQYISISNHPKILSWEQYKENPKFWILNHPTLCFKKSAVLEVGNYNKELQLPFEDLDLELRLLKKYGFIYNIPKILLLYRIHSNQITHKNREKSKENDILKLELINKLINN
jgi:glycosyltransferase involved in cell wall biosynthesis